MDNLSVSDKHYDKKNEDMQVRLDKLYDEIEEIETSIEAVETKLYNIKQEKYDIELKYPLNGSIRNSCFLLG